MNNSAGSPPPPKPTGGVRDEERLVSSTIATTAGALIIGGFFGIIAPATSLSGWWLFWVGLTGLLGIVVLVASSLIGLRAIALNNPGGDKFDPFNWQAGLFLVGLVLIIAGAILVLIGANEKGNQNSVQAVKLHELDVKTESAVRQLSERIDTVSAQTRDLEREIRDLENRLEWTVETVDQLSILHQEKATPSDEK